ncbi:MAG: hypothetical protein QM621_14985 [Aeromicrobium sp.]
MTSSTLVDYVDAYGDVKRAAKDHAAFMAARGYKPRPATDADATDDEK